jgi:uncharacterized membrane protein YkvA (DUF1232 family)
VIWTVWILVALAVASVVALAVALSVRRSRTALMQLARLVPLCLALLRDLLRDPEVPRHAKVAPLIAVGYLALPLDLIPDFLPGIGQLDDAVVVAWALRHVVASAGRPRVEQHWRGDPATLQRILRLARVR